MFIINDLQMNLISALNNPQGVDVLLNKPNQSKTKYNCDYNQTLTNESNFGIK